MNDFYSEHLVKKRTEAKDVLVKIVMIVLTLFCILFHRAIPLGIVVSALLIAADVFIFRMLDIEYEYMYINGEMDIDMVIHKARRKRMCTVSLKDAELVAPSNCPEMLVHKKVPALDYSSKRPDAETYEILVNASGVRKRIIFEPKQAVVEDMWMRAPRKVIRK
jgi:hypothetical protein